MLQKADVNSGCALAHRRHLRQFRNIRGLLDSPDRIHQHSYIEPRIPFGRTHPQLVLELAVGQRIGVAAARRLLFQCRRGAEICWFLTTQSLKLVQQRPGGLKIGRVEALSEQFINGGEQFTRSFPLAAVPQQLRHVGRGAQLP